MGESNLKAVKLHHKRCQTVSELKVVFGLNEVEVNVSGGAIFVVIAPAIKRVALQDWPSGRYRVVIMMFAT